MRFKSKYLIMTVTFAGFLVSCGGSDSDGGNNQDNVVPTEDLQLSAAFSSNCAVCHGTKGEGKSGPRLYGHDESFEEYVETVRNGKPGEMPAFDSSKYSDDDLKADYNALKK